MNTKIKELVDTVGTDVSGKWLSIDNVEILTKLIVKECVNVVDTAEPYQSGELILKHFGIKE
jgi:hypothetical protein